MPRITLDVNDDGEIVGQTPAELDAIFKRIDAASRDRGHSKGMSEAAEKAKKQIEDNVKAELAKHETLAPLEQARYKSLDQENANLKKRLLEVSSQGERALKEHDESHARETATQTDALTKRENRLRDLVKRTLRAEAVAAGARDESLVELDVILGAFIGFDDDMNAFVRGEDGQPRLLHGKPIEIPAFVKEYLESHPHHRRSTPGQGRGARASVVAGASDVEVIRNRIEREGMSTDAIEDLFQATRSTRHTDVAGGGAQPVTADAAKARIKRDGLSDDSINDLFKATRKG